MTIKTYTLLTEYCVADDLYGDHSLCLHYSRGRTYNPLTVTLMGGHENPPAECLTHMRATNINGAENALTVKQLNASSSGHAPEPSIYFPWFASCFNCLKHGL